MVKTVRPVAQRIFDTPLPTDDVFASIERLYHQILAVKKLLTDRTVTSIRMVLNPEKMVIKEAQRAFTFLSLFDFGIDAVVVNRLLPPEIKDPYYGKWREIQAKHMELINESFQPLPVLTARLWDQEIVGLKLLSGLAGEVYRDLNPADILQREPAINITQQDGRYVLSIPVPFASKDELETWISGDELVIKYKNYKRSLVLPRALASLRLVQAELLDQSLKLNFEGDGND